MPPKRGNLGHPRQAALGVQTCLGLESTTKKSSKLLLRTRLPLSSSQEVATFFIPIPLVPLGLGRREVLPALYLSSIPLLPTTLGFEGHTARLNIPLCLLIVVTSRDPGSLPSFLQDLSTCPLSVLISGISLSTEKTLAMPLTCSSTTSSLPILTHPNSATPSYGHTLDLSIQVIQSSIILILRILLSNHYLSSLVCQFQK